MKNFIGGIAILASLFILGACGGSPEEEIVGTWNIDLNSVDIELGEGFPQDMKNMVSGYQMMMMTQSAEADKVSIEFMNNGKFVIAAEGDKQEGKWEINGETLTLSATVEGQSGSFDLKIDEIESDKMTISLSAEDLLAQIKKEMPQAMKAVPDAYDVNDLVKGTSIKASFKKK